MTKNKIIIDELKLYIHNFNGMGIDYKVYACAQDPEENDMYSIEITPLDEDGYMKVPDQWVIYADSSGNSTDDFPTDEVSEYVLDLLFNNKPQGIIRGF